MISLSTLGIASLISYTTKVAAKMGDASAGAIKDALVKAAIAWESRHKARWIKQVSPDDKRWARNNPMWDEIKANQTPLTGITQGMTRTWRGMTFRGHSIHMRSALERKIHVGSIEFTYPRTVQERAVATQEGLMGSIMTVPSASGSRKFIFNIPARPHTGFGPDDATKIEGVFGESITEVLES